MITGNEVTPDAMPKDISFNLDTALYTADSYMWMADRAVSEVDGQDNIEGWRASGPMYIAISSMAFSLEVYLKAVIFATEQRTVWGHDLESIWHELQHPIRDWLTSNFDANYRSTGKDWSVTLAFSHVFQGTSNEEAVQIPGASAFDMLKGHRRAFEIGRYGFEIPASPGLKTVLHNIPGLQLLCWIVRKLAYHCVELRRAAIESTKGIGGHHAAKFKFPEGTIERYPSNAS